MAKGNEQDDLRARIGQLSLGDQLHLFELVLSDYRQARATDDEAARQELAAVEAWHRQRREGSRAATVSGTRA